MRWVVSLMFLGACSDDPWVVDVGMVNRPGPRVLTSAYANAGEPFHITTETHGGVCEEADHTDVILTDDVVEVTPYDRSDTSCEAGILIGYTFRHTTTVMFPTPGWKTIRVSGRVHAFTYDPTYEVITTEVTFRVQSPDAPPQEPGLEREP